MGLYIPNIEMPKEGFVEILIRDDGTVQQTGQSYRIDGTDYYTPYVGEMPVMYKAVPVPPHGKLGDLDALQKQIDFARNSGMLGKTAHYKLQKLIKEAPTIIPAEEGKT